MMNPRTWRVIVAAMLLFIAAETLEIHRHLAGIKHYEPSQPKSFALLMLGLMAGVAAIYSGRDEPK